MAVGTLLPEHSQVRSVARQLGFMELTNELQSGGGKVAEVAREVASLLGI